MSIETRINRLVKKTGVKKSRWTVPLRLESITFCIVFRRVADGIRRQKINLKFGFVQKKNFILINLSLKGSNKR